MPTLTTVAVIGLAMVLVFAGARKRFGGDDVAEEYARAGVPRKALGLLATLLCLGAAGLLVGLEWAPVGLVAAVALVLYFAAAVAAHVRADDARHAGPALVLMIASGAALAAFVSAL